MIVAVENTLNEIKDGLEKMGYTIVDLKESESANAIVYYRGLNSDYSSNEMSYNTFLNGESAMEGTFLVNAYGKSIVEIDQILKNRSYSPLFTGFE